MQYPLISEYVRAIQDASDNLGELAHLVPVLDDHGEPYRSSGAFAVVFKMRDEQTRKCYALKCFTEEQEGRAEAYRMIADELDCVDSSYVTSVKYLDKEIFVDSSCEEDEFPVLLMDWVEGETMETYIAANYQDEYAMAMLCYRFCKMAAWLRSQPFAHGDIKPDNIMVRPDGTLTLVDYDGMFVPAMKGLKSPTIGTKDFSHPLRTIDDFDETIDDFALASIALSLKAISLKPSLLDEFGAADRLLFSADDYRDLSKSKAMLALLKLVNDEELTTLLSMFLLTNVKKNLAMCSFRLFVGKKPENKIELISTKVTDEDWKNAITDDYGVKYSKDGKKLLKANDYLSDSYAIIEGTKAICDYAFYRCSLNYIVIPNSVKSIGNNAFSRCTSLSSLTIPPNVTQMKGNPFGNWYGQLQVLSPFFTYVKNVLFDKYQKTIIAFRNKSKKYVIPNSVTSIGNGAFGGCDNLTSIVIPDSVTRIGNKAFSECKSLTAIIIPDKVTSIEDETFLWCESLTSIVIPDSVTRIGNLAFRGCSNLTNIVIPNSVISIGDGAFGGCDNLTSIVIPDSVTRIGNEAFSGCKSLTSIIIPNSVTSIGKEALSGCSNLTNIVIPNSVTSIGDGAFSDCFYLSSIIIPDSVTSIGDGAFSDCFYLSSIIIPDSVTSIGNKAFSRCKNLTNIVIPNSVTSIGNEAFCNCELLINIVIPNSVTSIGNWAFCGCESLLDIVIPNSVISIGNWAFAKTPITNIVISDNVTHIGKSAFYDCHLPSDIKKELKLRFGNKIFEDEFEWIQNLY